MKRIMIRLSALSIIVALGIYAIAEAQRDNETSPPIRPSDGENNRGATVEPSPVVQPIAMQESSSAHNTSPAHALEESSTSAAPPNSLFENNRLAASEQPSGESVYSVQPAASVQPPTSLSVVPAPLHAHASDPQPSVAMANYEDPSPVDRGESSEGGSLGSHFNASSPTPASPPETQTAPLNEQAGGRPFDSGAPTTPLPSASPSDQIPPPSSVPMPLPSTQAESPRFNSASNPASADSLPNMPVEPPREPFARRPETDYRGGRPAEQSHNQEGTGLPGQMEIEGAQQAQLVLQKTAPEEIHVGQPTLFEIRIRNTGQTVAEKILLRDEVPRGTYLIDTVPTSTQGSDGSILWELGSLNPGEESIVTMQVVPQSEGEIGSVATISYQTSATARSIVTQPILAIEHSAPPAVLIGEEVLMQITLTNRGTGEARRVILEEDVPQGLSHQGGHELEYEIGTLKPGETRQLELSLTAAEAGRLQNTIRARGEGNLLAEHTLDINVTAPDLALQISGPSRRYLEREASYQIVVANPGSASAHDINLSARLPRGLQFVNTNNAGEYDPQQHVVYWSLEELPAGQNGAVEITVLPIETGQHRLQLAGVGDMGLSVAQDHLLEVEGLAELVFEVADISDPVEAGGETIYEIRVVNQGSKVATNIRLAAVAPQEMTPLNGDGPTRAAVEGQQITFEPLARLAPKADTLFRVRVQCNRPGDHRIRVLVASDDMDTVIKEEATRVYSDQ